MTRRDRERTAVRLLRDSLGLTRDEFASLLASRGHKISAVTIETYEKEVPAEVLRLLSALAHEHGLAQIEAALFQKKENNSQEAGEFPTILRKTSGKSPGTELLSFNHPPDEGRLHAQLGRILAGGVAVDAIAYILAALDQLTGLTHGKLSPDPGETGSDLEQGVRKAAQDAKAVERDLDEAAEPGKEIPRPKEKPGKSPRRRRA